jgi:glycosyltransferase involved in cell wall biosynthesis/GT2 family glycosyltransferase
MSTASEISVVIPCFNDGRFLKKALGSVRTQILQPIETVIINDGSTDSETIQILQNLDFSGVRVIPQANCGPSAARNTGIRSAKGNFIYFLDSDNLLLPECLATLGSMLQQQEEAIAAYSRIQFMNGPEHGQEWGQSYNPYLLLVHNLWDAGILLRRDAVEKYGLWYDESMRHGYEDWEFHIRLAKIGRPILFCPKALYKYRVRGKSRSLIANNHHAEIIGYIRSKHADLFDDNALLTLKSSTAPALSIDCSHEQQTELESLLKGQTFRDWVLAGNLKGTNEVRYRLFHAGTKALKRLPREALEAAVMSLECNHKIDHAVVAVKNGRLSWLAGGGQWGGSISGSQPLAVMIKCKADALRKQHDVHKALGNFQILLEFPDQAPDCEVGWNSALLQFSQNPEQIRDKPIALRKKISALGKLIIGRHLHHRCVRVYDTFYSLLVSDKSLSVRKFLRANLGHKTEELFSKIFYGLFLATPPSVNEAISWKQKNFSARAIPPLFTHPVSREKIRLLIATAWLTEGGVDQIVLDMCRLLDPDRFQVAVVTTLPSSHPWDHWARKTGVSVYHLADFLKPDTLPNGFVHLALNLQVDCLHIIHSKVAYETARTLKSEAPWISISDRNEVLDPGGGFPRVTVEVGRKFIDARTVSYKKLALYMCKKYGLPQDSLRVIYTGATLYRIDAALEHGRGVLQEKCNVSRETPIVIFVGRLASQKRPEVFVRSVAKIFEIHPQCTAHFAMIGDGHLMPSVTRLICKLNLEKRIHLLGAHSNAVELMRDATLLMMPSAYEGLALVSYEAMALGIPQIFANVGGQDELITPETGILIDNGRGEETRYAKACLELLADPDRRARMAAAGKERIKNHFTAENAVKQYAEIFEQMAELSRKRAAEIPHLRPPHINPLHELY